MHTSGLKTHIIITIALLLVTTTLLSCLVITMFWQQSLIRTEAERIRSTLEISAQVLQPGTVTQKQDFLLRIRETSGLECLAAAYPGEQKMISLSGACNTPQLSALLEKSMRTNSPAAETSGSTWGVFTLRPEQLIIAVPLDADHPEGSIGTVTSLKPVYHRIRQKQKTIIIYLAVNILLITTVGFFRLVKSTVKPLERLVRMTEEYDENNDFLLFPAKEGSEFGQLSASLNQMIRRIDNDRQRLRDTVISLEEANARLQQTQEEMIRTEKLASIGRLSAGLAHEIGNPIGIIQGYLELLQRESLSSEDRLQFAKRAAGELNRINQLIRQLLDFARTSPPGRQQIHINELLRDILD
ncbi:MAG TPA: sensor histidine kinase, partial [Desulfobacteraceae bacterium]|nr:sensor histidine kinase [Desulfobacteraceae bacterium]